MSYVFGIRLAGKKLKIESRSKHVFEQSFDYLEEFDTPDCYIRAEYEEILRESINDDISLLNIKKEGVAITPAIDELESLAILRKISDTLFNEGILNKPGTRFNPKGYKRDKEKLVMVFSIKIF